MTRAPAGKMLPIILCAALTACGSANFYKEPTEPTDRLVELKVRGLVNFLDGGFPPRVGTVEILAVDGKATPITLNTIVKIKSGPHNVVVVYDRAFGPSHQYSSPTHMDFSAEPAHFYGVHGVKEQDKIVVWISEAATGQEVARSTVERKE